MAASKAQRDYARSIVKYFQKAKIRLVEGDVLADMDVWVARHKLHKAGITAWLDDDDRRIVAEEVHRVGKRVLDRRSDFNRIANDWRGPLSPAERGAARDEAMRRLEKARTLARAAVGRLIETYGEQYLQEIESLASSYGATS